MPRPAPACIVIAPTVTDHIMQVASDSQSLFDHGGPHHRLDPVRAAEDQHTREHRKHQQHRRSARRRPHRHRSPKPPPPRPRTAQQQHP
jgi:hypothetical protein